MMNWSLIPDLDDRKRNILREFVTTVLPAEGARNWSRHNELENIHRVVNQWMKKEHGFYISPAELFSVFEQNGYSVGRVSMDDLTGRWSGLEDHRTFPPYSEHNAYRLHVNVSVLALRLLAEANKPLPAHAPKVKRVGQAKLNARLHALAQREGSGRVVHR